MTLSDEIRELHAQGMPPTEIVLELGCSRQLVHSVISKPVPTRKAGRPRVLARCEHCGQRLPPSE